MAVTPEQSECLQKVLLGSEKPMTGVHKFIAWNENSIWGYTFEREFNRNTNPLHKFEDYFEQ